MMEFFAYIVINLYWDICPSAGVNNVLGANLSKDIH